MIIKTCAQIRTRIGVNIRKKLIAKACTKVKPCTRKNNIDMHASIYIFMADSEEYLPELFYMVE